MLLIWHLIRLHNLAQLLAQQNSWLQGCTFGSPCPGISHVPCYNYTSSKVVLVEASILTNMRKGKKTYIACRIKSAPYCTNAPAAVETLEDRRVERAVSFALCTRISALALPVA